MIGLSMGGLTAFCWSLTGVSIVLSIGRFVLRHKTTAKLQWDDAFHAFALISLVTMTAIYTAAFRLLSNIAFFVTSKGPEPPLPVLTRYSYFEAAVFLWWVCIYSVKFSFLVFYRKLFNVSRTFMKAWWIVAAYTFSTFWACVGGEFLTCGSTSNLFKSERCPKPTATLDIKVVEYWCILNVSSTLAIMALPLYMLKGLQMPTSRKVGLGCLFCLAFIEIAFDIKRTVKTIDENPVTLGTVWDILEPQFAVIISCLPTYRSLFSTVRKREAKRYKDIPFSIHDKAGRSPPGPNFGKAVDGSPSQQDSAESVLSDPWLSVSCAEAHEMV